MKLLLSLLVLLSVSCGNNDNNNNQDPVNAPAGDPPNNATTVPEIQGSWTKACASIGAEGYRKSSITVRDNTLQLQEVGYQKSSTCEGTSDFDARANFTFTVPNYTTGQTNNMDMVLQQVLMRINSSNGVVYANAANLCGFNDWQINTDKDVTGRNCIFALPKAGEAFYQIFRASPTELFVGKLDDQKNGTTPETRPNELEQTPYTRGDIGIPVY